MNAPGDRIGTGLTVLSVEDQEINQFFMTSLLKKYGFEIIPAENGPVALDILESSEIDIVLMDIQMPVMCGLETIKELRQKWPDLPVFAVSAGGCDREEGEYIDKGFNRCIPKPVDAGLLVEAIRSILGGHESAKIA